MLHSNTLHESVCCLNNQRKVGLQRQSRSINKTKQKTLSTKKNCRLSRQKWKITKICNM